MYSWITINPFLDVFIETWEEPRLDGGIKPRCSILAYIALSTADGGWIGHDMQHNELGVKESNLLRAKVETENVVLQKATS